MDFTLERGQSAVALAFAAYVWSLHRHASCLPLAADQHTKPASSQTQYYDLTYLESIEMTLPDEYLLELLNFRENYEHNVYLDDPIYELVDLEEPQQSCVGQLQMCVLCCSFLVSLIWVCVDEILRYRTIGYATTWHLSPRGSKSTFCKSSPDGSITEVGASMPHSTRTDELFSYQVHRSANAAHQLYGSISFIPKCKPFEKGSSHNDGSDNEISPMKHHQSVPCKHNFMDSVLDPRPSSCANMIADGLDPNSVPKNIQSKLSRQRKFNMLKIGQAPTNANQLVDIYQDLQCCNEKKTTISPSAPDSHANKQFPVEKKLSNNIDKIDALLRPIGGNTRQSTSSGEQKRFSPGSTLNYVAEKVFPEVYSNVNVDEAASDLLYGDLCVILNKYPYNDPDSIAEITPTMKTMRNKRKTLANNWTTSHGNSSFQRQKRGLSGENLETPKPVNISGNKRLRSASILNQKMRHGCENNTEITEKVTSLNAAAQDDDLITSTSSWSTSLTPPWVHKMKYTNSDRSAATQAFRASIVPKENIRQRRHSNRKSTKGLSQTHKDNITANTIVNTQREMPQPCDGKGKFSSAVSEIRKLSNPNFKDGQRSIYEGKDEQPNLSEIPQIQSIERTSDQTPYDPRKESMHSIGTYTTLCKDDAVRHTPIHCFGHSKATLVNRIGLRSKCVDSKDWHDVLSGTSFVEKIRTYNISAEKRASEGKHNGPEGVFTPYSQINVCSNTKNQFSSASDINKLAVDTTKDNTKCTSVTVHDVQPQNVVKPWNQKTGMRQASSDLAQLDQQFPEMAKSVHSTQKWQNRKYGHRVEFPYRCTRHVSKTDTIRSGMLCLDEDTQGVKSQTESPVGISTKMEPGKNLRASTHETNNGISCRTVAHTLNSILEEVEIEDGIDGCMNRAIFANEENKPTYNNISGTFHRVESNKPYKDVCRSTGYRVENVQSHNDQVIINPESTSATTTSMNVYLTKQDAQAKFTETDITHQDPGVLRVPEKENGRHRCGLKTQHSEAIQEQSRLRRKSLIPRRNIATSGEAKQTIMERKNNSQNKLLRSEYNEIHGWESGSNTQYLGKPSYFYKRTDSKQVPAARPGQFSWLERISATPTGKALDLYKRHRESHNGLIHSAVQRDDENTQCAVQKHTSGTQAICLTQKMKGSVPVDQKHVSSIESGKMEPKTGRSQEFNKLRIHASGMEELGRVSRNPSLARLDHLRELMSNDPVNGAASHHINHEPDLGKSTSLKGGIQLFRLAKGEAGGQAEVDIINDMCWHKNEKRTESRDVVHGCNDVRSTTGESLHADSRKMSSTSDDISLLTATTLRHRLMSNSPIACRASNDHSRNDERWKVGQMTKHKQDTMARHTAVASDRLTKTTEENINEYGKEAQYSNVAELHCARTVNAERNTPVDVLTTIVEPPKYALKPSSIYGSDGFNTHRLTGLSRGKMLHVANNLSSGYDYIKGIKQDGPTVPLGIARSRLSDSLICHQKELLSNTHTQCVSQADRIGVCYSQTPLIEKEKHVHENGESKGNDHALTIRSVYDTVASNQRTKYEVKQVNKRPLGPSTDTPMEPVILSQTCKRPTLNTYYEMGASKPLLTCRADRDPPTKKQPIASVKRSFDDRRNSQDRPHIYNLSRNLAYCQNSVSIPKTKLVIVKQGDAANMQGGSMALNDSDKTLYNSSQYCVTDRSTSGSKTGTAHNRSTLRSGVPIPCVKREVARSQMNVIVPIEDNIPRFLKRKDLKLSNSNAGYNQCNSSRQYFKPEREQKVKCSNEERNIEAKGRFNYDTCQLNCTKSTLQDSALVSFNNKKERCDSRNSSTLSNKLNVDNKAVKNRITNYKEGAANSDAETSNECLSNSNLFVTSMSPVRINFKKSKQRRHGSKHSKMVFPSSKQSTCSMKSKKSACSNSPLKSGYSQSKVSQESTAYHFAEVECPNEKLCRRTKLVRIARNDDSISEPTNKPCVDCTEHDDNVSEKLDMTREINITEQLSDSRSTELNQKCMHQSGSLQTDEITKVRNKFVSSTSQHRLANYGLQKAGGEKCGISGFANKASKNENNTTQEKIVELGTIPAQIRDENRYHEGKKGGDANRNKRLNNTSNGNVKLGHLSESINERDLKSRTKPCAKIKDNGVTSSVLTVERCKQDSNQFVNSCEDTLLTEGLDSAAEISVGNTFSLCGLSSVRDDSVSGNNFSRNRLSDFESKRTGSIWLNTLKIRPSNSSTDSRKQETTSMEKTCPNKCGLLTKPTASQLTHFQSRDDVTSSQPKTKNGCKPVGAKNLFPRKTHNRCHSHTTQHISSDQQLQPGSKCNRQIKSNDLHARDVQRRKRSFVEFGGNNSGNFSNISVSSSTDISYNKPLNSSQSEMISISAIQQERHHQVYKSQQRKGQLTMKTRKRVITNDWMFGKHRKRYDPQVRNTSQHSLQTYSPEYINEFQNDATYLPSAVHTTSKLVNECKENMTSATANISDKARGHRRSTTDMPTSRHRSARELVSENVHKLSHKALNDKDNVNRAVNNSQSLTSGYSFDRMAKWQQFAGQGREHKKQSVTKKMNWPAAQAWTINLELMSSDCGQSELTTVQEGFNVQKNSMYSYDEVNKDLYNHLRKQSTAEGNGKPQATEVNTNKVAIDHTSRHTTWKQNMTNIAGCYSNKNSKSKLSLPVYCSRNQNTKTLNLKTEMNTKPLGKQTIQNRTCVPRISSLKYVQNTTKNNSKTTLANPRASTIQNYRLRNYSALDSGRPSRDSTRRPYLQKHFHLSKPLYSKTVHGQENLLDNNNDDLKRTQINKENPQFGFSLESTLSCDWYKPLKSPHFHYASSTNHQDRADDNARHFINKKVNSSNVTTRDKNTNVEKELEFQTGAAICDNEDYECMFTSKGECTHAGSKSDPFLSAKSSIDKSFYQCSVRNSYSFQPMSNVSSRDCYNVHTEQQPHDEEDCTTGGEELSTNIFTNECVGYLDAKKMWSDTRNCSFTLVSDNCAPVSVETPTESPDIVKTWPLNDGFRCDVCSPYPSPNTSLEAMHSCQTSPVIARHERGTSTETAIRKFFPKIGARFSYLFNDTSDFDCSNGSPLSHHGHTQKNAANLKVRPPKEHSFVGRIVQMFERKLKGITPMIETMK